MAPGKSPTQRSPAWRPDLKLTGLDYNNLVVFAFLGYVLFQIPIGFFLNKGSPAVYLSCAVILWGICSMSCGFVQTYAQMSVVRVLVGAVRIDFSPSIAPLGF